MYRQRSCGGLFGADLSAHAQQVTDGKGQLGAVQRIEVEMTNPARIKAAAEFGGDGRGDQLPRGGMIVQPLEQRSEEHTSELQSLMRISYAVFCLKNKTMQTQSIPYYTTNTTETLVQ